MITTSPLILSLVISLLSLPSSSATSISLSHNKAHHLAKRDGDGAWLLREKSKLDSKYGGVERSIEKRERKAHRRAVTLADHNSDASYSASVSIGTPAQQFDVAIDTGSSDFWVADASCASSSSACSSLTVFQTSSSSTFKNSSTAFGISYGSGSASGTVATDTVALGGYTVVAQTIALVDTMSAALISSPMSGIMGFGFQALSVTGAMPWWQSLASSSGWSSPLFGVYLARFRDVTSASSTESQGGTLTLGYTDSSLYSGSISYVSVTQQKYWNIPIASMSMQGTSVSLGSSTAAAIDTGTTLIGGPESIVAAIYAAIPGSQLMGQSYPNYYEYPCSTDINFQITFGTFTVTVTNEDFNIGRYSSDSSMCTGGVYIQSLSSNSPVQWVVGDTLLKNTYTVFRSSPAAVGFASLPGSVVSSASAAGTGIPSGTLLPDVAGATETVVSSSSASASVTASKSGSSASGSVTGTMSKSSSKSGASAMSSGSTGVVSTAASGGVTITSTVTGGSSATTSASSGVGPRWQLASNGVAILSVVALFVAGAL